jgi:ABC-type multidrug transport system ATPase subunit/CRP-like cAMP-binding protein
MLEQLSRTEEEVWGEHGRRLRLLRHIDPFQHLSTGLLTNVATSLRPLPVLAGTVICRAGEADDQLYIVESGTLVVLGGPAGAAREIARIGPGECFGELVLPGDGPGTTAVRAETDARLWALPAQDCRELRARDPGFDGSLRRAARRRQVAATVGVFEEEGRNLATLASARGRVRIGRGPDNDLIFNSRLVSRQHAIVEASEAGIHLRDLGSSNGTWVNGVAVRAIELRDGDEIQVGDERLVFDRRAIRRSAEPRGIRIEAAALTQTTKGGATILHDVSLAIQPGEFVAIVGGSGAGKSTLLDALAGVRPASGGTVEYNGRDYYANPALFRSALGYVPQDDIIHTTLPVRRILRHAAKLRLPADTSPQDIDAAVDETLAALGLAAQAGTRVRALSGGQRKRCSIGVELLTRPRVFFLDEPTSGLDPATDRQMMRLLRGLAEGGSTVVLTTHATKNVNLCDKVVFLARGGHLAFFGTPQRALRYFAAEDFDEIYDRLANEETPEIWAQRFRESADDALPPTGRPQRPASPVGQARDTHPAASPVKSIRRAVRQCAVLSQRTFDLLIHDRASFLALLAPPLAITVLLLAIFRAGAFGSTPDPTVALQTLLVLGYGTLFFGISAGLQEITKEVAIFRRERKVNLGIGPYLLAKLLILAPILLLNVAAMVAVLRVGGRLPVAGASTYGPLLLTLALNAFAGLALGLCVSAAVPTSEVATRLQSLVLLPQVVFSGGLLAVAAMGEAGRAISGAMVLRWTFESLGRALHLDDLFVASNSAAGQALSGQYGDAFAHDPTGHWAIIAAFTVVPLILTGLILRRKGAAA